MNGYKFNEYPLNKKQKLSNLYIYIYIYIIHNLFIMEKPKFCIRKYQISFEFIICVNNYLSSGEIEDSTRM